MCPATRTPGAARSPRSGPGSAPDARAAGTPEYWFRLVATPDRDATGRAFARALDVVRAEGHVILVVDDAREVCCAYPEHKLAQAVEPVTLLGGSAATPVILATQELGFVPGRAQGSFTWAGHTSGLDAAKDAAKLFGKRGAQWAETMAAIEPCQWVYVGDRPGDPGPVLTTVPG